MFSSFSARSRKDCDFFCCIIVCTAFCSTCRRTRETSHARNFSDTCHGTCLFWLLAGVNSEKPHDIPNESVRLSGAKGTWCFYTRSHHKNVSKPIVCCIRLFMTSHSSVTWIVVDNLVYTFGSPKASGDLTCWMFIIDVIWPHVDTMTTEEVVDNQETHTNSIFDSSCTPPGKISREFF